MNELIIHLTHEMSTFFRRSRGIGSRSNHRDDQDQQHFEEVTNNDSANNLDRGLVNDVVTEDFQVCNSSDFLFIIWFRPPLKFF